MAFLLVATLTLTGCASFGRSQSPAPSGSTGSGNPVAFDDRARAVIKVWTDADMPGKWHHGFIPLQDLTVIDPNPGFTDRTKLAFLNGYFRMLAPLLLPPPPGVIRFPDGSSMKVPLRNEEDVFASIYKGECRPAECDTLRISRVQLSATKLLTSRGMASVPAWEFTIEGLHSSMYVVAVASEAITEVPAPPAADWPHLSSLRSAQDLVRVTGNTITFRLGVGMCDKKIKPYVYETADAIAIGGTAVELNGACEDALKLQPETVTLAAPLGSRAILDAVGGHPLMVGAAN